MPEKVHKKFGDEPGGSTSAPVDGNTSAGAPSPSKPSSTKGNARTGGRKKLQVDKPKPSIDAKASKDSDKKGTRKRQADPDSAKDERARKSPKLESKPRQSDTKSSNFHGKPQRQGPSAQELQKIAKDLDANRKNLPVWLKKMDIRWGLRNHDILLVTGETGSGKSTQIPQFLYTEPWCKRETVKVTNKDGKQVEVAVGGMIAVTQPRRVAAITLAQRVAAELGSPLNKTGEPGKVGYSVRFDSCVPPGTKIKFVTEGTLLQEMLTDPYLRKYSAVIVDEIHERSVDVDLIAGFLRQLVHGDKKGRGGAPLKVIVMSATFDLGGLEAFFSIPGTHPGGYEPGKNHGRIIAPHILEQEKARELAESLKTGEMKATETKIAEIKVAETKVVEAKIGGESDESRRSSLESFSSWGGFSEDNNGENSSTSPPKDQADGVDATKNSIQASNKSTSGDGPSSTTAKPPKPKARPGVPEEDISENGVAIEYIRGRQYPVETLFDADPIEDYMLAMLQTILDLHIHEPLPGDILAFLTGQDEIESLKSQLEHYGEKLLNTVPKMQIMPLYGSLSPAAQQAAFMKVDQRFTRKIVLATNIAETSVTVAGVRYVVDCGKVKVKKYRPHLGMESLLVQNISRTSALQRMGRAGREAKGKCHRIYTMGELKEFDEDECPEILRCDVLEAVLKMKARGVDDVLNFPLMDMPDSHTMQKALVHLYVMGALDLESQLTKTGKMMASFPLPAVYGRVVIAAAEAGCLLETIDIVACLTSDSEVFLQPKSEEQNEAIKENRNDIYRREGDIITLLTTIERYASEATDRKAWCEKRFVSPRAMKLALDIRKQLRQLCHKFKLLDEMPPPDPQPFEPITPEMAETVLKTFLKAFITKTAVLADDGGYNTTYGKQKVLIHPSSVLYGRKMEAILFLEHVYTTKNYAKKISAIQADWIGEAV
ncbi:p-loop containing nucleoside triphosphate hydrolase [Venustampulla echinocandica]|uniref:RNA helicase n=1 Tax=Venustampulla echinocandica TaxID=2656787 RepID=A0A370TH48_9HELO|nr:p-loop containing nucleoside triphosphate hydrolase [Venustampulla echinocandica]RDL34525.1 p-loop containing nucleoside triphosphate hydrolase [Venustampulla echinocandica]